MYKLYIYVTDLVWSGRGAIVGGGPSSPESLSSEGWEDTGASIGGIFGTVCCCDNK